MHGLPAQERQKVAEFFSLASIDEVAFEHANFSFLAVRSDDGLELAQGHIILPVTANVPPKTEVITPSICGCSVRLSEINVDSNLLIDALFGPGLDTPVGKLRFGRDPSSSSAPYAHLQKFPADFYTAVPHPLHLSISAPSPFFANRQAEFQNDLRAAVIPYDSVFELANELGLRPLRWDLRALDISAHSPVGVDLQRRIKGGVADLAMLAGRGVDVSHARLGYRVLTAVDGKVVQRGAFQGNQLTWKQRGDVQIGEASVNVPDGALIQCFASYRGQWTQQGWIGNPDTSLNPRRVAHEVFDANLQILAKYLSDPKELKQNARQLEIGVAHLLFICGFAVHHFEGRLLDDAVDLLAVTPRGNFALVECTTQAIDNGGKLSKLLERTAKLSARLSEAGYGQSRCLPVVVTTLSRGAVADLAVATEKGIVVFAAEDLEKTIEDTRRPRDADELFDLQWNSVHPMENSLSAIAQT